MRVSDILDRLLDRFPSDSAEPWDHIGLSVGDPDAEVTGVACALDATFDSLVRADALGANVLLTHHPVYLSAPDCFAPVSPDRPASSGVVYEAARRGIAIISLHTNLDRSFEARRVLPELLGFEPLSSLEHRDDPAARGLGSVCDIEPVSLSELALRSEDAFQTHAQVWGLKDAPIRRVAFMGGSLGEFGELALACRCDAIITGELGYHRAQDLALRGLSVILLGHDRSEQPFCRILADAASRAGVAQERIHIISLPQQWWVPTQGGNA